MRFNPWFAYDCMIVAFNQSRWQSAYDLASALLLAGKTQGTGAPRWFKAWKWMQIVTVEQEARRHNIDLVAKGVTIDPNLKRDFVEEPVS